MRRVLALAGLALLLAAPALARPRLDAVVLLERHGVRSPTKVPPPNAAGQAWAQWPVAPGELTPHGAEGIARMGEALRRHYAPLLAGAGCGGLFVWGDAADHRTRQSADALAAALKPGCPAAYHDGDEDPLFHPTETPADAPLCPVDAAAAQGALAPRLADMLARRSDEFAQAQTRLAAILGRAPDTAENRVRDGKISGPLATASTLTENLFLEYAQGMTAPGWGRATQAADIAAVMPLHAAYTDLARRTPYLAQRGASLLAHQIAARLSGHAAAFAGAAPVPADARLVALLGHDTNLSNLAGALGLDWTLKDQPDPTAPDTVLAFELWRDGQAARVRLVLYYQTLDQLRTLARFDARHPVPRQVLTLPGCGRTCALKTVVAKLDAVAPDCVAKP